MSTTFEEPPESLFGDHANCDRIIYQALAAAVDLRSSAQYLPSEAERVYVRLVKRSGHSPEMGKALTDLAQTVCSEIRTACEACKLQMFCVTGRSKLETQVGIPFIDLFSGCGGFSLGFEASGFAPVLAIDSDRSAIRSYGFNRPSSHLRCIVATVESVAGDRSLRGMAPLIIGGPPCQSFSNANRQRLALDPRDALAEIFLQTVRNAQANVFVLVNVPGVRHRPSILAAFANQSQYTILEYNVDASDLGLPQRRNRVFIFGVRTRTSKQRTEISSLFKALTEHKRAGADSVISDAIRDLPRLRPPSKSNATTLDSKAVGFAVARKCLSRPSSYVQWINVGRVSHFILNHRSKFLNERDRELYRLIRPGEKSDAASIAHIMPYANRAHVFRDKFYRLRSGELSKTITAHMYYDCHMYIHPTQHRGLTPREAARIQGFPDDYFFVGRPNEWYRQIGNAVSPPVAREIARIASNLLAATGIKS